MNIGGCIKISNISFQIVGEHLKNLMSLNLAGCDSLIDFDVEDVCKNCLILDFGTATTFDIIKNGVYEGGVIAPGVKLSMMNLSSSTALLPIFTLKKNQNNYF